MKTSRAPILAALIAAGLGTSLAAPVRAFANSAENLLYERTLMDRAGGRCRLFNTEIAAALSASGAQARGAALRGGSTGAAIGQIEQRATLKAYAVPCASPDLATAAARVRKAFDGYADLRDMSFPGAYAPWRAERRPWPLVVNKKVQPGPRWRLSEFAQGDAGAMTLGLTTGQGLVAVTLAADAGRAAGARLVLRDLNKAADPFIDPRRKDLGGRVPPRALTIAYLAGSIGPAPMTLLAKDGSGGTMVVFPDQAAQTLAMLDPREAVTVELVFPTRSGERVETTLFEVGDFAAGRAFLAAGR